MHWRYKGANENGITAEIYGATPVGEPNPQDFTPYNGITSTDVEGWLVDIFTSELIVEGEITKTRLEQMQEGIESQILF